MQESQLNEDKPSIPSIILYALIINTKTKIENIYEIQIGKLYKSNSPLNECIYIFW